MRLFCPPLLIGTILLAACRPWTVAVPPTPLPAPLPTNTPVPTPTSIPIASVNFESMLIQPGDLPASLAGGQFRGDPPDYYGQLGIPRADNIVWRFFEWDGEPSGWVNVSLYETPAEAEHAYDVLTKDMARRAPHAGDATEPVGDIGEMARLLPDKGSRSPSFITFVRCHAFVDISMTTGSPRHDAIDVDALTTYAKRLDRRLKTVACR